MLHHLPPSNCWPQVHPPPPGFCAVHCLIPLFLQSLRCCPVPPQVLAPSLASRAFHFGSDLALKEDWVMMEEPYFPAHGEKEAKECKRLWGGG